LRRRNRNQRRGTAREGGSGLVPTAGSFSQALAGPDAAVPCGWELMGLTEVTCPMTGNWMRMATSAF